MEARLRTARAGETLQCRDGTAPPSPLGRPRQRFHKHAVHRGTWTTSWSSFSLYHKIALERRSYGDTAEHEGNQCYVQAVCSPVDALLVDGQCTPNLGTRKAVVCGGDELTGKCRHVERRSNGGCGRESVHLMSTSDSPGDENGAPLVDPKGTVTGVSSISSTRSTNLTEQSVFSLAP